MPKFEIDPSTESREASFYERRRLRRIRMIVELTLNLISGDRTCSHREALCLIDCARKAVLELYPGFEEGFARIVQPHFERVLVTRWPNEKMHAGPCGEIVN
ncbi:MAG TPA: hypothetical protein VMU84_03225 [Thermoanaerobaculia bacterium]|nr:hypothetical protein [Thermoanaerobaculia bacterium]